MKKETYKFSSSSVNYYFNGSIINLKKLTNVKDTVIITDEHVYDAHKKKFKGWNCIVLKPGEEFKEQATVDAIIQELIDMKAQRQTRLIGVGGGVVTDLTGYVASVYLRGVPFGFVPTSLLAMVDAAIGGKNGVNAGVYKNMIGVIRQPEFLLYDMSFLDTLPQKEWENGFAEIIKHACILDEKLFRELESNSLKKYQKNRKLISGLVKRNALMKTKIVQKDEFEKGDRRLLNFGHTLGHALENQYELSHGQAISIGMAFASVVSEKTLGFKDASRVTGLLLKYDLPTYAEFDKKKVFQVLKMDKKGEQKAINYVLLKKLGKGMIRANHLTELKKLLDQF